MIAWLEGRFWQAIAAVAGGLALICLVVSFGTHMRLRGVEAERDRLATSISAPLTGWAARLAQCHANTAALEQARQLQNQAIEDISKAAAARTATVEQELRQVRADHVSDSRRIAALVRPLGEHDPCARLIEADQRIQELLK